MKFGFAFIRTVLVEFVVLLCAADLCGQAGSETESPGVLKDGGRVVFLDGSGGALPEGVVERFGDRIRDGKKGLRVELWTATLSGEHVLDRVEGDILGKRPTHVVIIPGADWSAELVGKLLGKLEGGGRALVLFWPEEQPAPVVVRDEPAVETAKPAAEAPPPILLLPVSLIGKGVPDIVEALTKLLGV